MAEASGGGRGSTQRTRRAVTETSAGGVVFRTIDAVPHFLLIRDPYENWGLPKGHVEPSETPEAAARREVTEETGLVALAVVAELPTIDWYFRHRRRLIHKYCYFFLMESAEGEPRPQVEEGITDCIWLPTDRALATITYENAREVLRSGAERLGLVPAAQDRLPDRRG